jgi:hypothetical protein
MATHVQRRLSLPAAAWRTGTVDHRVATTLYDVEEPLSLDDTLTYVLFTALCATIFISKRLCHHRLTVADERLTNQKHRS